MEALTALAALTAMEIVLGIDNIVFIAIVASKLPIHQQPKARLMGLTVALVMRLALLLTLKWLIGLTKPFATFMGIPISGKSLILVLGGLFLIGKSTYEIHDKLEGPEHREQFASPTSFPLVVAQIVMIDLVFALDSVITAIGMARQLWVMVTAIVIAMVIMLLSAGTISHFINRHPTLKILALSFLLLIGVMLVAEGLGKHIERGYIYFAMGFSLFVELLNMRLRAVSEPVKLHSPSLPQP
ncbi:MAG: TerC family protein [Armatimonadetes bacterium]|nr:TerC family protein [Armatimonadota bacterium]MDW8029526.1 TerC family protein [Armatimonadota bacterium]